MGRQRWRCSSVLRPSSSSPMTVEQPIRSDQCLHLVIPIKKLPEPQNVGCTALASVRWISSSLSSSDPAAMAAESPSSSQANATAGRRWVAPLSDLRSKEAAVADRYPNGFPPSMLLLLVICALLLRGRRRRSELRHTMNPSSSSVGDTCYQCHRSELRQTDHDAAKI
ncbi:hypothetical protein ACLOJK_019779 [Asimina triloba]